MKCNSIFDIDSVGPAKGMDLPSLKLVSKSMNLDDIATQNIPPLAEQLLQTKMTLPLGEQKKIYKILREPLEFQEAVDILTKVGLTNHFVTGFLLNVFSDRRAWDVQRAVYERFGFLNSHTHNAMIRLAGRINKMDFAKRAFDAAIAENPDNMTVYRNYITAIRQSDGDFEEAKRAFDLGKEYGLDEYALRNYMIVAGRANRFEEAEKALLIAEQNGIMGIKVAIGFLVAAIQVGKLDVALQFYKSFENQGQVPVEIRHFYIMIARKLGRFDLAKQFFFNNLDYAMPRLFAEYIKTAGSFNRLDEAKRALDLAIERGKANTRVLNSYILAAGKPGSFAEARRVFKSLTTEKRNIGTFEANLCALTRCGQFKEARRLLKWMAVEFNCCARSFSEYIDTARKQNLPDEVNYAIRLAIETDNVSIEVQNNYMLFLADIGEFRKAKKLYTALVDQSKANIQTHKKYIVAAAKCGQFSEAKTVFQGLLTKGIASTSIYNGYLRVLIKSNQWTIAENLFRWMKEQGIANSKTSDLYLGSLLNSGRVFNAESHFWDMIEQNIDTCKTYRRMITAFGKEGDFEKVQRVLSVAEERGLANNEVRNAFIKAAGDNGHFDTLPMFFERMVETGSADIESINHYMAAAGKCNRFNKVEKTFDLFENKGKSAPISALNTYLQAAKRNNKDELVNALFQWMKENRRANRETGNLYLDAALQFGWVQEAESAFQWMVENRLANAFTYMIYLDILYAQGKIDEARLLFKELPQHLRSFPPTVQMESEKIALDCRGFSLAALRLAVFEFIESNPLIDTIYLIPGQGCQEENRDAFLNKFKEWMKFSSGWTFRQDPNNKDILIMTKE